MAFSLHQLAYTCAEGILISSKAVFFLEFLHLYVENQSSFEQIGTPSDELLATLSSDSVIIQPVTKTSQQLSISIDVENFLKGKLEISI